MAKLKAKTKCHAVYTWAGDEHAGFYGEAIYKSVVELNQPYRRFSTLLRATFDEALSNFPEKSIAILHIDGRHFYQGNTPIFEWTLEVESSGFGVIRELMRPNG